MPKSKIYLMGIATLIGFPVVGVTIVGMVEDNPWSFDINWFTPVHFSIQVIVGLTIGILFGFTAWWIINLPQLKEIKMKYGVLIHRLKLTPWEIIFLSFSAGVGEEFLFRGVIQPYWGVWITAVFFVAIHGYLDPRDKKMMFYGLSMTVMIGLLGYLKIYLGLLAPMAAHFAIDVVLLRKLSNDKTFGPNSSQPSYVTHTYPENLKVNEKNESSEEQHPEDVNSEN